MMRNPISLLFAIYCVSSLFGQDTIPLLPIDERVIIGELSNGMRYYIHPNQKPENRAELRLVVDAGSIDEDEDQQGLAHFVEHMAFNGTENFEKNELIEYLQSTGIRFGPDLNAYTSFDETVYMLQVRTDSADMLDKGLLILSDWAKGLLFDSSEVDKERGVVVSELRSGLNADQRMRNAYLPVIFKDSKYANRLPIGKREILENAPVDVVARFYKDWYRPDLMAIVVVGDIQVEEIEAKIAQVFSPIMPVENPRPKETYSFPAHRETLVSIVSDEEAPFTLGQIYYKHANEPTESLLDFRRNMIRSIYNRMLNQRLAELQQSADPPFLYAYSGYGNQVSSLDAYQTFVNAPEGQILKSLEAAMIESRRVKLHGFLASELDRQRQEILSEMLTAAQEDSKTQSGRFASKYVQHYLKNNPIPSATQTWQLGTSILPSITIDDVNALAAGWMVDSNRVVIITGPQKDSVALPSEAEVFALLTKVDTMQLKPYVDAVSAAPLIPVEPAAGTIVSETFNDTIEVYDWTLSNDVRVIYKKTDFQNDEIRFTAFSPGGHSLYADEEYASTSISDYIVSQAGVGTFSNVDLQKKLSGVQANVSVYISEREEGAQGSATLIDAETMFKLLYLRMTAPREDEPLFKAAIDRQKNVLANIFSNPNYYFSEVSSQIKFGDHPRTGIPTVEELDKVEFVKVHEVYKERFADLSDFTFIFVGNLGVDSLKNFVNKYIASLPNLDREDKPKDTKIMITKGTIDTTFNYGQAPKVQVEATYHGVFDWDIRKDRATFSFLLDVLRDRLRISMREDQGGVYGVAVRGSITREPREGYVVGFSFNAEPDQTDTLIETAKADIQKLIDSTITDEELLKIAETKKQSRVKGIKENGFWLNMLRSTYANKLPVSQMTAASYSELIDSITKADIQEMAQKIFATDDYIQIVMYPEEKE